ncbi:MAG: aminotransferase class IV [Chloroflexota bacterium]
MIIYLNGDILPQENAQISASDRGLLLGDGIFETLRVYQGRIYRLDDHLDRLMASANTLGIPMPVSRIALCEALDATLEANQLAQSDASMRLTLTRGAGPRGLDLPSDPEPTLLISAAPLDQTLLPPATALISSIRRNQHSPLASIKSLNFLDNILARSEARSQGLDEALMLNTDGQLAEASAANLFIAANDSLLTPTVVDGALPGITRAVIFEISKSQAIPIQERSLSRDELLEADEAFLTNSIIEVRPLIQVEGQIIGHGGIGPLTERIQDAYRRLTAQ